MAGPEEMFLQGFGIPAAHFYDFLTRLWPEFGGGTNYIQTPQFVRKWFGGNRAVVNRGYGTAIRQQAPTASGASSGFSSAFSGSWGGRGQGRRLGGD